MTNLDKKNPFEILQVAEHAEEEVIDAAFRRLAQKYHPDHNSQADAHDRMREINWAYEVLKDPLKHAQWHRLYKGGTGDLRRIPENRTEHYIEPEMMYVSPGAFIMGSPQNDEKAFNVEKPAHSITLDGYWISRFPITVEEYRLFLLDNSQFSPPFGWDGLDPPPGRGKHPLVGASWIYCIAFCRWLSRKTAKEYMLPSEAEWEKAARGIQGQVYPWGNNWDVNRCNALDQKKYGTTPVDQYSPFGDSPFGCADMAGNVWEWTRSIFLDYPYQPLDGREGLKQAYEAEIAVRGGSFNSKSRSVRTTCRDRAYPGYGNRALGFRVVISPAFSGR